MTAGSSPPETPGAPPQSMIERMTLIMDTFDGGNGHRSLEDIALFSGLPRSTTHRILNQLAGLGWLEHTPSGYRLGRRVLDLAGPGGEHGAVREAAAAVLHELQTRTGMVVHLAVLAGAEVCYLDKVGGPAATAVPSRVGGRAPAHSTALGKAMLAALEPEQVDARMTGRLTRLTSSTIGDAATLHGELSRIRQGRGLAYERGESAPGIACVAATVHGPEGSLAALSVVGGPAAPLEALAPLVLRAARRASANLGPESPNQRRAQRPTGVPQPADLVAAREPSDSLTAGTPEDPADRDCGSAAHARGTTVRRAGAMG